MWIRIPQIVPFRQRKTWNENSEFHLHPFNIRWLYSWRVDKICILLKSLRVLNSPSEQSWESFTSRTLCVLLLWENGKIPFCQSVDEWIEIMFVSSSFVSKYWNHHHCESYTAGAKLQNFASRIESSTTKIYVKAI